MQFKTSISKTENGKHLVRGHNIIELINKHSFSEVIFLLLRGNFPAKGEKELLESMLVAATENGIAAPSLYVPRIVAASGNDFHTALASGMLAIGERHGGAAEKAAEIFASGKTAQDIVARHKIIAGFGHKIYKDKDPRAEALREKTRGLGLPMKYFDLAEEIQKELKSSKGKNLPLNIDGAIACCMLTLGFDAKLGKAFFLIARIVGMSAHIMEEYAQDNSYYRLGKNDVTEED